MKKIETLFIIFFFILLLLPVIFLDRRDDATSEIDNRVLVNNPFKDKMVISERGNLTDAIEDYIKDRIGFRNYFIREYTIINDKLFNEMVHPSYEYGKDGYVFFKKVTGDKLDSDDFYDNFINMIVKIKEYCDSKNVPFIFAFEPSKSSVLKDKVDDGINYNDEWVKDFLDRIRDKGVIVVDNYKLLEEKYQKGEKVFNQKYDAGHWNYLGAYYGVNNILDAIKTFYSKTHINLLEDFDQVDVLYDTLLVSEFPIKEKGVEFKLKDNIESLTNIYQNDLDVNHNYHYFNYWKNDNQKGKSPKTLIFQGSYMNGYGYRFLQNSLSEYIAVHNYQNIINFDYYYNIFKPECVVFEVTEYTLSGTYFNKENMKNFKLNPDFSVFKKYFNTNKKLDNKNVFVENKNNLINVLVKELADNNYAYLKINNKYYDMKKEVINNMTNYSVTITKDNYDRNFSIILVDEHNKKIITYK